MRSIKIVIAWVVFFPIWLLLVAIIELCQYIKKQLCEYKEIVIDNIK